MAKPRQQFEPDMIFGYWTILSEAEDKFSGTQKKRALVCKCRCGTIRSVLEQNLISKRSTSCGCKQREVMSAMKKAYWRERGSKSRSTDINV